MEYNKEAKPITEKEANKIHGELIEVDNFLEKIMDKYKDVRQMRRIFKLQHKLLYIISRIGDFTTPLTKDEIALSKKELKNRREEREKRKESRL